jgi:hypothetical protein
MRRFYYLSAAVMLAIIVLAACNSRNNNAGTSGGGAVVKNGAAPVSTPNVPSDGVRRVTTVELRDMLDKGTAVVIDTRGADAYKQNHIKGSISVPVDQVASRINDLPRDKMIVAYCS